MGPSYLPTLEVKEPRTPKPGAPRYGFRIATDLRFKLRPNSIVAQTSAVEVCGSSLASTECRSRIGGVGVGPSYLPTLEVKSRGPQNRGAALRVSDCDATHLLQAETKVPS